MLDKLQFKEEKNLLIQGLPSSIEKQFIKLSFAKNVTPLLKARKIDFALVFAINEKQLNGILKDVLPALRPGSKLWIAYPKKASKIVTDLDRESSWSVLAKSQFESIIQVPLDHVWTASRFKKTSDPHDEVVEESDISVEKIITKKLPNNTVIAEIPLELKEQFKKNKLALNAFELLSIINKNDFIEWITGAKKEVTKQKRLKDTIDKLLAGRKNPSEK